MKTFIWALGLAIFLGATSAVAENDTLRRAERMTKSKDHDGAIALIQEFLEDHPGDAGGLMALANAYHAMGDYESAVDANQRASATVWAAPTARYNEACALSLLGRADEAHDALIAAMQAGFLDYDLIASDSDLDNLRAKHDIEFPKRNEYLAFEARNGTHLAYKVIPPQGYDRRKSYPAVVLFAPGNGQRSADWAVENLVGDDESREWIVVYAIAPEDGWYSHPAHHAFNDLLDEVRDSYKIEGNKYHMAGFGSGASIASTYSQMSKEYFVSLTTFSAWHWKRWGDDELATGFGMPTRLVVGGKDEFGQDINQHVGHLIGEEADVRVEVVTADDHLLRSVRHGKVLEYIPLPGSVVSRH